MNSNSIFRGFVSVTRCTVCICSTFWLLSYLNLGYIAGIKLIPFWLMSLAAFMIIRTFLLKPRSQNHLILISILLFAAETAAILLFFFDIQGGTAQLFALMSVALTVTLSVFLCIKPPSHSKALNAMEMTVIYFIFFLWSQISEGFDFRYSIPLLCASVLSLAEVMRMRISGIDNRRSDSRVKSIIVAVSVLAAVLIPIVLFANYGAKPLGHGVTAFLYAVFYCVDKLLNGILAFIIWLASLLPDAEEGWTHEIEPYVFDPDDLPPEAQPNPTALLIIQILLILFAVALVVFALCRFKNRKIGGTVKAARSGSVSRKKISFFKWIKSVFAAIKKKIVVTVRILLARGSARELYLFVLKNGRILGLYRLPGETPCAFITRTAHMMSSTSEDMHRALLLLSNELSLSLYSDHQPSVFPKSEAKLIRQGFRKSLRKAKFNALKLRIKSLAAR